jgi:HPt (histidine-containing phosphotransfer) domain-containing protein
MAKKPWVWIERVVQAVMPGSRLPAAAGHEQSSRPPEPAVLDPSYLDTLFELQRSSGREVVSPVIESYVAEAPRRLAALRGALARGDREEIALVAHTLKGASAQLGVARAAAVSRELEERGREGSLEGAGEMLDRLEQELAAAAVALLARCRQAAAEVPGKAPASS